MDGECVCRGCGVDGWGVCVGGECVCVGGVGVDGWGVRV